MDEKTKYLSVEDIVSCPRYPFTKGQIRHYLLSRHRNGLEKAIRKIGKRIFIREDLFEAWIEKQQGGV